MDGEVYYWHKLMIKNGWGVLTLAVGLFLLLQVPVANFGISYADEGYLVLSARNISRGQVPYRDFFMTTTPGAYYLQAILNWFFGNSLLVERYAYVVGVVILLLGAKNTFGLQRRDGGLFLLILVAVWVNPGTFAFYSLESMILVIWSWWAVKKSVEGKKSYKWLVVAGILAGLAVVFKQSVGMMVVCAEGVGICWLGWEAGQTKRYLWSWVVGVVGVMSLFFGYFFIQGAGAELVRYTLFFAGEVKSHQTDFVLHRLLALPLLILGMIWFRRSSGQNKIKIMTLGVIAAEVYLLFKTERAGRLLSYLGDPIFWVYLAAYLGPIYYIAKNLGKVASVKIVEAWLGIAVFLAMAASGYSVQTVAIAGVFLFPIWLQLSNNRLIKVTGAIVISILIMHKSGYLKNLAYNEYPIQGMEAKIDTRITLDIWVSQKEKAEVERTIRFINGNTSSSDQILCFPHCPMINILAERDPPSFFSFFYFETFRGQDQKREITELEKSDIKYLVLQKDGYINKYAGPEYIRLLELVNYFARNYSLVVSGNEFDIYER